MRREDFKEIRKEHFETCKMIIENLGDCRSLKCWDCPFNTYNLVGKYTHCGEYIHPDNSVFYICINTFRLMKAKMFIEKFEGEEKQHELYRN